MLEQGKKIKESTKTPVLPILGAVLMVATAGAILLYLQPDAQEDAEVVLTDEARAYLPNLDLSNVDMVAHEDGLGQTLLEITGDIGNLGDSRIAVVEANCVFRDVNGVEIQRQRSALVSPRTGALARGETQTFRLAFDNVPVGWNQTLPDLYIAQIQFGD